MDGIPKAVGFINEKNHILKGHSDEPVQPIGYAIPTQHCSCRFARPFFVEWFTVRKCCTVRNQQYSFFVNGDETPVRLEDCPKMTVDMVGTKRVRARTAGKEKFCITAFLMIGASIVQDESGRPSITAVHRCEPTENQATIYRVAGSNRLWCGPRREAQGWHANCKSKCCKGCGKIVFSTQYNPMQERMDH